jgi:hypothetical protein
MDAAIAGLVVHLSADGSQSTPTAGASPRANASAPRGGAKSTKRPSGERSGRRTRDFNPCRPQRRLRVLPA